MVKLSDAFKYNGTSSLTKFSELQAQCKNTAYFTSDRPINKLSSWESYQCISSASLSKTSIAAAGEVITVSYNIPYRSGITPTITSTVGSVSNITSTDANGNGSAKISIGNNSSSSAKSIKVKISINPGGVETYKELSATQLVGTVEYRINNQSVSFVAAGETKTISATYDTYWNGEKVASSTKLTDFSISEAADSSGAFSCSGLNITATNNTTESQRSGTYKITKSGYTNGIITLTQTKGTKTLHINSVSTSNISRGGGSATAKITATTKWNGKITSSNDAVTGYSITETSDSTGRFSASGTSGTVTVSATNNKSTSSATASYTISKSGYESGTLSSSQSAGRKEYGA